MIQLIRERAQSAANSGRVAVQTRTFVGRGPAAPPTYTGQSSTAARTLSRLAAIPCCHSAIRPAMIRPSSSGRALIAALSPEDPGPTRAHCRISTPSLLGSTSKAHVAAAPSGP